MRQFRYVLLFAAACAVQGCAVPPKRIVDDAARTAPEGRNALVVVAQGEIRAEIRPSNVAAAAGGGLLPALLDVVIEQGRTAKVERYIRPMRDALGPYDFDRRALEATQIAANKVPWLSLKNVTFTKDGSEDNLTKALDGG